MVDGCEPVPADWGWPIAEPLVATLRPTIYVDPDSRLSGAANFSIRTDEMLRGFPFAFDLRYTSGRRLAMVDTSPMDYLFVVAIPMLYLSLVLPY